FEGCGGFEITDEVRVTIAAQACLLLLHRETDYFPHLLTILVYPLTYMVQEDHRIGEHVWKKERWVGLARQAEGWDRWFYPGEPSNMARLIPPMVRMLFFMNLPINLITKITPPMGCRDWRRASSNRPGAK